MPARTARLADLPGVYEVCRATAGDDWGPPDVVGHVFAGPYVLFQPDLARVLADGQGIAGYILGCADTRAFEAALEREWWPPLREQYPDVRALQRPPRSPDAVVATHPAHLHIDLLDRARGRGYGRELVEWLCAELVARGVPGIHLGVGTGNTNAIAFYRHLGFAEALAEPHVLWMTRDLR
jgi:ribosomal protein S18 acetylase RimI-like enzyme